MRAVMVASLLVGCGFQAPGATGDDDDDAPRVDARVADARPADPDAGPDAWLPGFTHRRLVTIAANDVNTQDLTVLVALVHDSDFDDVSSGAANDIGFARSDGTPLAFEVEASTSDGDLAAWVRLPKLAAGTQFYLYYTRLVATEDPLPDSAAAWDVNTYQAVWHFTDYAAPTAIASTDSHLPMSKPTSRDTPPRGKATIGEGRNFTTMSTLETAPDQIGVDHGLDSFSYSVLVRSDDMLYGFFDTPLWKNGAFRGQPGFDIELGMSDWVACIADDNGSQQELCSTFSAAPLVNEWHYLSVVVDREGKAIRTYLDGARKETLVIPSTFGSVHNELPLTVGRPGYSFHGMLDEVRVYSRALTEPELAFEAKNLLAPTATAVVSATVETQ